ncbi:MAG: transposase, partial [Magnetococcales bacterium]|nr:transposase [Magnetococcales bacterium]
MRRALKKKEGKQAIGKSRGGRTTKIHAGIDALGNPLRILLTEGQAHDVTKAEEMLDGYHPEMVIADKAYDADHFITAIHNAGAVPVIPPKSNRNEQRDYDAHW